MNKTITLNNGVEMPLMGYGVWQIAPEACEQYVLQALAAGYRSIDTAQAYYNKAWGKPSARAAFRAGNSS